MLIWNMKLCSKGLDHRQKVEFTDPYCEIKYLAILLILDGCMDVDIPQNVFGLCQNVCEDVGRERRRDGGCRWPGPAWGRW